MTLGTISAVVRNPILERFVRGFILLGSTVPGFWLALLLILFFAVNCAGFQWLELADGKLWSCPS